MTVPVPVGVKVALHVAAVELSGAKVHGEPANDPVAVPLLVNATVPCGTVGPTAMSLTVAVHTVPWLITMVAGLQETAVLVA